ncbi:prolyl oligopeptidase family serine peptidase [Buchananella hordeovulneris]|nr:prolyl oligopeptidase family serine peptidase [Buchananella hordeovulneris]
MNDKRHIMAWGYLIGCGGVVLVGEHLVPKDAKIVSSGARVSRCFCISGDGKLLINVVHHDGGAVLLCKEGVAVKGNAYEAISLATGVVFMEQRENELNIYGLSDDGLGPVSHEVIRGKLKSVSATSEMVCCTVRMGAEDIVFILRGINLIQEQIIRQFGEVNISRAVALGDHILTFGTFFQRRCIGQLKLQRAGYEWQEIRRYPWDESVSCTDIDFHACRLEVRCESFVDSPEPALVDCASEMIYFEQCDSEKHRRIVVEDTVLADDGEKLPVTLFGNSEDMLAPKALMLTVYGAYGVTIVSSYASHRQSLIRRGVVYAIARVRGGGDRGSSWHAAGSGKNKIRGVLDLIQIVDRLRQKYKNCRPMLAVEAGSAGGLLVAAAINIRTDLFDSVILTAPYVCPLRTVRNESDAYVEFERAELGISSDLQGCETIEAYDPLLNVRNNCSYPPILVVAGKSDTKVRLNDVLEWCRNIDSSSSGSCKYVARIIVLYDGGHEGPSSRTCHYMTWAIQKAFICKTLNIEV